jgi:hypothetical protein
MKFTILIFLMAASATSFFAGKKTKSKRYWNPFDGTPGKYNAITDVAGVEVGHTTLIQGSGKLEKGKGPVRTGVTAIFPAGKKYTPVFAELAYVEMEMEI